MASRCVRQPRLRGPRHERAAFVGKASTNRRSRESARWWCRGCLAPVRLCGGSSSGAQAQGAKRKAFVGTVRIELGHPNSVLPTPSCRFWISFMSYRMYTQRPRWDVTVCWAGGCTSVDHVGVGREGGLGDRGLAVVKRRWACRKSRTERPTPRPGGQAWITCGTSRFDEYPSTASRACRSRVVCRMDGEADQSPSHGHRSSDQSRCRKHPPQLRARSVERWGAEKFLTAWRLPVAAAAIAALKTVQSRRSRPTSRAGRKTTGKRRSSKKIKAS